MLRILLDPAAPVEGEYDHAFQLSCILEAEVFRQLGRNRITINSTRRGPIVPTERQRKQQVEGWMPDVVVPVQLGQEGENVRVTKTAGCCVEYIPVILEKAMWAYQSQELENLLANYYLLADKFCAAIKKTYASNFPAPVEEAPVEEEVAPAPDPVTTTEEPDVAQADTEPTG